MTAITADTYFDSSARTAGETFEIGSGAKLTVRTDSRWHANSPASGLGSIGNISFTDIGGEFIIDASNVRWLEFNTGVGNVPAIGTTITQGAVSGYLLGVWPTTKIMPIAVGAAMPASGFIKFREVTGGTFAGGALTGIGASATGADVIGWLEVAFDSNTTFNVPTGSAFRTKGNWFQLGTANGSTAQFLRIPSNSAGAGAVNKGAWVDNAFWTGLSSLADGWDKRHIGYATGYSDGRLKFINSKTPNKIIFGEELIFGANFEGSDIYKAEFYGLPECGFSIIKFERTEGLAKSLIDGILLVSTDKDRPHELKSGMQVGLDFRLSDSSFTSFCGIFTATVIDEFNFTVEYPHFEIELPKNVIVSSRLLVSKQYNREVFSGDLIYCEFTGTLNGLDTSGIYEVLKISSASSFELAFAHLIKYSDQYLRSTFKGWHEIITHIGQVTPREQTSVVSLSEGVYTFGLEITNSAYPAFISDYDTVSITVLPGDGTNTSSGGRVVPEPPLPNPFVFAHAGPDRVIYLGEGNTTVNVTLDGSLCACVTSPETIIKSFEWNQETPIIIVPESSLTAGSYVFLESSDVRIPSGQTVVNSEYNNVTIGFNYPYEIVQGVGGQVGLLGIYGIFKMSLGDVPTNGAAVKIPNVIIAECSSSNRSTNINSVSTGPRFSSTDGGDIDINYLYALSLQSTFAKTNSLTLTNSVFQNQLDISECASSIDINNVGIGCYGATDDVIPFVLTDCAEGGSIANLWVMRGGPSPKPPWGSGGHVITVADCSDLTFSNINCGVLDTERGVNGLAFSIDTCPNTSVSTLKTYNGSIKIVSCDNFAIKDVTYNDRFIGRNNGKTPLYMFNLDSCDGLDIGNYTFGESDNHPRLGIFNITNCKRIRTTLNNTLPTGEWHKLTNGMKTNTITLEERGAYPSLPGACDIVRKKFYYVDDKNVKCQHVR